MIKSIFNCETFTPDYGLMAIEKFAHAMALLSEERIKMVFQIMRILCKLV